MAEEGPGGRVGPAGGLGWGEVLGPAGGSPGPVLVVVGGGGRVCACATSLFWETSASLLNHCTGLTVLIT